MQEGTARLLPLAPAVLLIRDLAPVTTPDHTLLRLAPALAALDTRQAGVQGHAVRGTRLAEAREGPADLLTRPPAVEVVDPLVDHQVVALHQVGVHADGEGSNSPPFARV